MYKKFVCITLLFFLSLNFNVFAANGDRAFEEIYGIGSIASARSPARTSDSYFKCPFGSASDISAFIISSIRESKQRFWQTMKRIIFMALFFHFFFKLMSWA